MAEVQYLIQVSDYEQRLMVNGLNAFRNDLIRDGKPAAAVLPHHVGKLPHIADSHGTARTDQQKAQAGFKRLSFHVVLLFQSSFIL